MTCEEFSNEFDVLINSYSNQLQFGNISSPLEFDEYEKSVFLTQAQEKIVLGIYNGNLSGYSLEEIEEYRGYLTSLYYETDIGVIPYSDVLLRDIPGLYLYSIGENPYLDDKALAILIEHATFDDDDLGCANNKGIEVVPITHDELFKVIKNPFRGPNKRRVLRLSTSEECASVMLISKYKLRTYYFKILCRPSPIILEDLPKDLSIDGDNIKSECTLHKTLHRIILEMAVQLALASRGVQLKK